MANSKVEIWNQALSRIGVTAGSDSGLLESENETTPEAEQCRLWYPDCLRRVLKEKHWRWAKRQAGITEVSEQTNQTAGDDATLLFTIPYAFIDTQQVEVTLTVDATTVETTQVAGTDYTLVQADPTQGLLASVNMIVAPATGETLKIIVTTTRVGWEQLFTLPADCITPIALLFSDMRHWLIPHDQQVEFEIFVDDSGIGRLLAANIQPTDIDTLEYISELQHVPLYPGHFVDALVWLLTKELALSIRKDPTLAGGAEQQYRQAMNRAGAYDHNDGHEGEEAITPALAARDGSFDVWDQWWRARR